MLFTQEDVSVSSQTYLSFVDELRDQDVVCGKDKLSHSHVGNRQFRKIIHSYSWNYQNASRRDEKTRITSEIIGMITREGGRFVKLDESSGTWVEIDAAATHDKVSHSLRSARNPQRATKLTKKRKTKVLGPSEKENELFEQLLMAQQTLFWSLTSAHDEDGKDEADLDFSAAFNVFEDHPSTI